MSFPRPRIDMSARRLYRTHALSSCRAAIVGFGALLAAGAAARDVPSSGAGDGNLRADNAVVCDAFTAESEAACLARLTDIASRTGDLLRIKLQNGKAKAYKSDLKACRDNVVDKCVSHRLGGFFPARQLILIHSAGYEGAGRTFLLSRRTGAELEIMGPPQFSPSSVRFVSDGCDEMDGTYCGLGIWSTESDPAKPEWRINAVGVTFKQWRGDDHVMVEQRNSNPSTTTATELVRTNGKWVWRGPPLKGDIQQ
jgi:hypothetical protein